MSPRLPLIASLAAFSSVAIAQQAVSRQAAITGGGSSDRGKCTVEVVVDGAAEVEVRGNSGVLRNLSGQPPQWRRFECTSAMPQQPGRVRFEGVDGRGRQQFLGDRNGAAVVRIEDSGGGREGYTFDLVWGDGGRVADPGEFRGQGRNRNFDYPEDRYRPNYRDSEYYRRYGHGFASDEAMRVCREAISDQVARRFPRADFHFGRMQLDDGPGRSDWVLGGVDVHRMGRMERFGFSCSVDFNTGRVRSADLDRAPGAVQPR